MLLFLTLAGIFSVAIVARSMPARYGFYLNEFDPYWDYYATDFLVRQIDQRGLLGVQDFLNWHDLRSWYPEGRQVAETSQVGLAFTGAGLYLVTRNVFGVNIDLYSFLILFPVFFGAATTIVVFLLARRIIGTSAGLFAALMIALSPTIIQRGNLGWFKSEPSALFFALFATFLYLKTFDPAPSQRRLIGLSLAGGALLGYAHSAWGGVQYFDLVFGLLFLVLPFLAVDLGRTLTASSLFAASTLIVAGSLPFPGPAVILGAPGLILLGPLAFTYLAFVVKRFSDTKNYTRNVVKILFALVLVGGLALGSGAISGLSGRYITVVYPFYRSGNPLLESVAEHQVPTGSDYFSAEYSLLFLSALGALVLFRRRDPHSAFLLTLGLTGIYVASSFSRLMVFSALAFALLGAAGFAELLRVILRPSAASLVRRKGVAPEGRPEVKVLFGTVMILLLALPTVYPADRNWIQSTNVPVSIAGASLGFRGEVPDWLEALKWIRENTPEDAIFAAWWDYGYWITVMGNRTTLADNATVNGTRIEQLARMFMSNEKQASEILGSLKAHYVVTFLGGVKFRDPQSQRLFYFLVNPGGGQPIGGDEAKKQWFIRIGGLNMSDYVYADGITPTPRLWESSLLGGLFPLRTVGYLGQDQQIKAQYEQGTIGVYECAVKYPTDLDIGSDCRQEPRSSLLKLVFASSSMFDPNEQILSAVLIYEVVGEPTAPPTAS